MIPIVPPSNNRSRTRSRGRLSTYRSLAMDLGYDDDDMEDDVPAKAIRPQPSRGSQIRKSQSQQETTKAFLSAFASTRTTKEKELHSQSSSKSRTQGCSGAIDGAKSEIPGSRVSNTTTANSKVREGPYAQATARTAQRSVPPSPVASFISVPPRQLAGQDVWTPSYTWTSLPSGFSSQKAAAAESSSQISSNPRKRAGESDLTNSSMKSARKCGGYGPKNDLVQNQGKPLHAGKSGAVQTNRLAPEQGKPQESRYSQSHLAAPGTFFRFTGNSNAKSPNGSLPQRSRPSQSQSNTSQSTYRPSLSEVEIIRLISSDEDDDDDKSTVNTQDNSVYASHTSGDSGSLPSSPQLDKRPARRIPSAGQSKMTGRKSTDPSSSTVTIGANEKNFVITLPNASEIKGNGSSRCVDSVLRNVIIPTPFPKTMNIRNDTNEWSKSETSISLQEVASVLLANSNESPLCEEKMEKGQLLVNDEGLHEDDGGNCAVLEEEIPTQNDEIAKLKSGLSGLQKTRPTQENVTTSLIRTAGAGDCVGTIKDITGQENETKTNEDHSMAELEVESKVNDDADESLSENEEFEDASEVLNEITAELNEDRSSELEEKKSWCVIM